MSHCAWAQQATTTSLSLGNLVVLKISNPRALGEQGPIYQAAISTVKCTALRAFKEMLFTWHPYGSVTLHSCCLQLSSPFIKCWAQLLFPNLHQVVIPFTLQQVCKMNTQSANNLLHFRNILFPSWFRILLSDTKTFTMCQDQVHH